MPTDKKENQKALIYWSIKR